MVCETMEHQCYFAYPLGGCHDDKKDLLTVILDNIILCHCITCMLHIN